MKIYGIHEDIVPIILFGPENGEEYNPDYNTRKEMKGYFKGGNPEIEDCANLEEVFSRMIVQNIVRWIMSGEVSTRLRKKLIYNSY